ncbi:VCBS repeat-containing protein [Streptomyces mobaraensis NBRC 13819 = DSM 40847]|uniref:FG-GAP repeat-containing protein n=1 Tax=Streptomyces mobaraensis (strain ATCC 29032 / DSM 40847 / JCM 4168 / NBRC 13819 / NCIMB 11159 / IPCR 16-22) TaxID=1223523 RepID=M3BQZ8_STRM1|nr:VCBS repeat-containing protein [Streptomyces mobaraensis]EMF02140.1 FG-GAP repeat-containing protein [Streptomyces mobaraensis NBRC 13819 = DSM 40847]QTT76677.1 VCBS repeat-containing protein [Streptomyces mobaraensis NBRC 13819 = DSM 40847]
MSAFVRRPAVRSALLAATLGALVLGVTAPSQAAPAPRAAAVKSAAATSTVGGEISRTEMIQRVQYWIDKGVPYSQSRYYPDLQGRSYRTDCSGLVSMAWHLPISATTWSLPEYFAWGSCGARAGLANDHADPFPAEPPAAQSNMTHLTPVGDLDGDGKPDIIAVEKRTGDLYRYSGPDFGGGSREKLGFGWNGMSDIVGIGDVTGDKVADILAVDKDSGDLYRYSGPHYNGSTRTKIGTNWNTMTGITGVGDLDGDGVPDLLAIDPSDHKLYRYSGPGFAGGSRVRIGTNW